MRIEDHMDGILCQYKLIHHVALNFQEIHSAIQGILTKIIKILLIDIQEHLYGQIERLA